LNAISRKRMTINVSAETKDLLDKIRHKGQSYDGLLKELVDHLEKQDSSR
jgi:hypothetical protein